ncbi:hypothetical protein ACU686_26735 [Yinghuangia aomiensis]
MIRRDSHDAFNQQLPRAEAPLTLVSDPTASSARRSPQARRRPRRRELPRLRGLPHRRRRRRRRRTPRTVHCYCRLRAS